MTKEQWEACPSTTNPVESINRESVYIPKDGMQTSFHEILAHLYRLDKVFACKHLAALQNVTLSYRDLSESPQEARRERKRKWRRRNEHGSGNDAQGN